LSLPVVANLSFPVPGFQQAIDFTDAATVDLDAFGAELHTNLTSPVQIVTQSVGVVCIQIYVEASADTVHPFF